MFILVVHICARAVPVVASTLSVQTESRAKWIHLFRGASVDDFSERK